MWMMDNGINCRFANGCNDYQNYFYDYFSHLFLKASVRRTMPPITIITSEIDNRITGYLKASKHNHNIIPKTTAIMLSTIFTLWLLCVYDL